MKNITRSIKLIFGVMAILILIDQKVWSAQDSADHDVTVVVPQVISLSSDVSGFTLTFPDFIQGSETNTQVVTYTVKANHVTKQQGVLQASLDNAFTGADIRADVGTFSNTQGNGRLVESQSGFKTIQTTTTDLCDRQVINGNGWVIRGTIPMTYKAVATQDLSSGSESRVLTVTLTDT